MTAEQPFENNAHQSTNTNMYKYLGLSIFWYYGFMLLFSIIAYFFTNEFTWNFGYILLFWMAYAIKDGSITACKWGIFFMFLCGCAFIVTSFMLLFAPAQYEFHYNMTLVLRLIFFAGCLVYVIWSIINLKFLIRVITQQRVRFWTKGVITGCGIVVLFIAGLLLVPWILNAAEGYSRVAIETKYAEPIEYLKKAVRDEVPKETNAPQVVALSQAYPEIISMSINTSKHGGQTIISKCDFRSTSNWWNGRTVGTDAEGERVKYVIYEDYTKDKEDNRVKIELQIQMSKTREN